MGIGVSLLLIAVGAILTFAVNATVSGVDISTVGVILMVVGGVGLLATLLLVDSWRRPAVRNGAVVREERVVRDDVL